VNAASYLRVDFVEVSGGSASVRFTAVAGRAYTLLYTDNLGSANWQTLTEIPSQAVTGRFLLLIPKVLEQAPDSIAWQRRDSPHR